MSDTPSGTSPDTSSRAATPATPATRATPASPTASRATPATPATRAVPAGDSPTQTSMDANTEREQAQIKANEDRFAYRQKHTSEEANAHFADKKK